MIEQILEQLNNVDKTLLLWLNFDGGRWMDTFWYTISNSHIWIPVLVAGGIDLWRTSGGSWKRRCCFLLILVAIMVLSDQLSSGVIKPLVGRIRPSHEPSLLPYLHLVNDYHGGLHGFVSGHATNITAAATWFWLVYRDRLTHVCLLFLAFAVSYSRLYLGVHYPGDIVCGALLGFLISYSAYVLCRRSSSFHRSERPKFLLGAFALTLAGIIVYTLASMIVYEVVA